MIRDRADLVVALRLAVDLEVGVMLQYLYAAYSLPNFKSGQDYVRKGLWSEPELHAICGDGREVRDYGWRGLVLDVAHEEMIHFLVVNNLLMAIGEPFHPGTVTFGTGPIAGTAIALDLEAFNEASLDRFITLEQPDDGQVDALSMQYRSISHLYQEIRSAFVRMPHLITAEKGKTAGEHHLFLNEGINRRHPDYQLQVDDLASAVFGIDFVVAQGEGGAHPFAQFAVPHFDRFLAVREQYADFRANRGDPTWTPAYPALKNPGLVAVGDRQPVSDPEARAVMRLLNGCYSVMIDLMQLHFRQPPSSLRRSKLMNASIDFMTGLVRPLAISLMTMPSGVASHTAGPGFDGALRMANPGLEGALRDLSCRCDRMADDARVLSRIRKAPAEMLAFYARYFTDYADGKLAEE